MLDPAVSRLRSSLRIGRLPAGDESGQFDLEAVCLPEIELPSGQVGGSGPSALHGQCGWEILRRRSHRGRCRRRPRGSTFLVTERSAEDVHVARYVRGADIRQQFGRVGLAASRNALSPITTESTWAGVCGAGSKAGHLHRVLQRAGLLRHHASSAPVVAKPPRRQCVVQLISTCLLTVRRPLWSRGRAKCCGQSGRDPSATRAGVEPGSLARQVIALGEVKCLVGRLGVQPCRRRQVAVALVEVRCHRGVAGQ